jgi:hypothetical protein
VPFNTGILDGIEFVLECDFVDQSSRTTTVSGVGVDMMFCGRSVKLPIFRGVWPIGAFSFWFGEPVRYISDRFLFIIPPAIGSLLGDGVLGAVLKF